MFILLLFLSVFLFSRIYATQLPVTGMAGSARNALLKAFLSSSFLCYLLAEALSVFNGLTRLNLILAWTLIDAVLAWILYRSAKKGATGYSLKEQFTGLRYKWTWAVLSLLLLVLLLLTVCLPINNWDSMAVHMARVAEWIQNRNIYSFPSFRVDQVSYTPGASYIVLNFDMLTGSDRLDALPQFFAMIGSLVAVSLIALHFKLDYRGQLLAALIAFAIPIGILESTTTQVDYISTFYSITIVYYLFLLSEATKPRWDTMTFIGIAVGMGMLTKYVSMIFVAPFALWLGLRFLFTHKIADTIRLAGVVGVVCLICTGGFFYRNYQIFGAPTGPKKGNDFYLDYVNEDINLRAATANMAKNLAVQVATPSRAVNAKLYHTVEKVSNLVGYQINDPKLNFFWKQYRIRDNILIMQYEDFSGNPVHCILIIACFLLLLFTIRKFGAQKSMLLMYYLSVFATFFLYCLIFKWTDHNTRHFLAIFVIAAPALAVVIMKLIEKSHRIFGLCCAFFLLIAALPVFFNASKLVVPLVYKIKQKQQIMVHIVEPAYYKSYLAAAPPQIHTIFEHLYSWNEAGKIYELKDNRDPVEQRVLFHYLDSVGGANSQKSVFAKNVLENNVDQEAYDDSKRAILRIKQSGIPDPAIGLALTSGLEYYYWRFADRFLGKGTRFRFIYYPQFMHKVYNSAEHFPYRVVITDEPDFLEQVDRKLVDRIEYVGKLRIVFFKDEQQKVYFSRRKFG